MSKRYRINFGTHTFSVYDAVQARVRGSFPEYDDAIDFVGLLIKREEPPAPPPVDTTPKRRYRLWVCTTCHAYNEMDREHCHVCGEQDRTKDDDE